MSFILIFFNSIDFFNVVDFFEIVIFSKFFNVVEVIKIIIANFRSIVFDLSIFSMLYLLY